MAEFKGRTAALGLAPQTNYVTPATAPAYTVPWLEIGLKDVKETIQNESSFGNIAKYNDSVTTSVHGEGDIKSKLWYKGLYYYLTWIFGQAPTKTANADGSYTYAFTMANNNQHVAETIFVNDPNAPVYYPCALLNEAKIEWTPSDFASLTASVISKRSVDATAFTPALAEDHEFMPNHLEFKIANTEADLATAPVATKFTSATLTVSKNVDGVQTSDSGQDYGAFANGDLEASVSLEKLYTDTTYRAIANNDTTKAISFGFVDTVNKAGTTNNTSLHFVLPKVKLSTYETKLGLSDTATETFDAMALLDLNAGYMIKATLVTSHNIT